MDSSFPSDLDSTSKLLSRLDLIEKDTRPTNMDDMEIDLVFEVPDTSAIHGSSGPSIRREDVEEIDTPSSDQRMGSARKAYADIWKDSGLHGIGSSSTARNDTEQLCRHARLARLISKTHDTKPSSQAQGAGPELGQNIVFNKSKKSTKTVDSSQKIPFPTACHMTRSRGSRRKKGKEQLPVFDGGDVEWKPRDKGKGIILSRDALQLDVSQRNLGQRRLERNDYIFPCNIAKSHISPEVDGQTIVYSVDGETCSIFDEISDQDNVEGIDLYRVPETGQGCLGQLHSDAIPRNSGSRRLVNASSYNMAQGKDAAEDNGETCSTFDEISDQDNMKGIDLYRVPETGQGLRQLHSDAIPRNSGPRRLVNGCISPYNMAQGKNAAEDCVGKTVSSGLSHGFSSHKINIVSPGSHADKKNLKKGKVILDDNTISDTQHSQAKPHSSRVCSITGKEVTVIADDGVAFRSSKDMGWRTTHDLAKKPPVYSLHGSANVSKREEDTSSRLSDRSHEIATGNRDYVNLVHYSPDISVSRHRSNPRAVRALSESEPESTRRRRKLMKGKRKCNSVCSSYDEYSSSVLPSSGTSSLQSSGQIPNSKLTRTSDSHHHGTILGSVIEVDELQSPQVRCSNPQEQSGRVPDDSSARARQLESDEILARQLQEQFFHELPGFGGTEEIDAAIAWSLQQEDARRAASIAMRSQSNPRDTSIAHLYAHYPQLPFQNSSGRSTNRARAPTSSRRRNFYSPEMDLETTMMAEVRRNFSSAEMDLEMRHNFLEALEAAFDNSNDMFAENILQIHRDFDENDYEILLALDENNHQHVGASESQINSLPQSVIQSESVEEACAVCLETPSVGDIIRHLPCLHKFHKECIDTWLRRRTSCPVCKSDIP